jgi:xanthine/uracil permease
MIVFEGEKTDVFWIGLIILGLTSVGLFGVLWMVTVVMYPENRLEVLKGLVPVIVGGVVFLLIGLYMMRSGVKKSESE